MSNGTNRSIREALVLWALVSGALYCTLLGYVFNHRGEPRGAFAAVLAAMVLVVPIYRSVLLSMRAR